MRDGPSCEQKLCEFDVLTVTDRVPERSRVEVRFLESALVDVQARVQQDLGHLDAVGNPEAVLADFHTAREMEPVPSALVAIAQQRGVLGKATGYFFPLEVFDEW
jgi:hypothetical protein